MTEKEKLTIDNRSKTAYMTIFKRSWGIIFSISERAESRIWRKAEISFTYEQIPEIIEFLKGEEE